MFRIIDIVVVCLVDLLLLLFPLLPVTTFRPFRPVVLGLSHLFSISLFLPSTITIPRIVSFTTFCSIVAR